MNSEELSRELLASNKTIDQAEVLLRNLLLLRSASGDKFTIPHLDVVVTLQTAVKILSNER